MSYKCFLVIALSLTLTAVNAFGQSEMDSEINDLQVKIVKIAPKPKAKPIARAKPAATTSQKVYSYTARPPVQHAVQQQVVPKYYQAATVPQPAAVASNSVPETRHVVYDNATATNFQPQAVQGETPTDTEQPAPEEVSIPTPKSHRIGSSQMIRRIEGLYAMTSSSFDGGDSGTLIPGGVSSQYNSSFANGMLLTDIDFGSPEFFIETGFLITQMGSGTGVSNQNGIFGQTTTTSEKVVLTYFGVPVNFKWRLTGDQDQSSFLVKAGAIPAFMASHNYTSSSNYSYESRFGAYNTFDILLDLGIGYDLRITQHFHGIIDIAAYQGVLPVLTNDSVFNYGLLAGVGVGYVF